jgi:hypothetical protein
MIAEIHQRRFLVPCALTLAASCVVEFCGTARAQGKAERPHAIVEYEGVDSAYGEAIAQLVDTAWEVYKREFGADLPRVVRVKVVCGRGRKLRLWNDGHDRIYLDLRSRGQLSKPSESGVFNLYGFCHELGHITMYRTLKRRSWLNGAAAEGFAHYAGSYVVDRVYASQGESLWPDRYDYRRDGVARLDAQLKADEPGAVTVAAGRWRELAEIVGRDGLHGVFEKWNNAEIDPAGPIDGLRAALLKSRDAVMGEKLTKWLDTFAGEALVMIERSGETFRTIERKLLSGSPLTLKYDDGSSDGKKSIAGSGHATFFDAPAGDWYITRVLIYGSRYGRPQPPREDVTITLCDEDLKPITSWTKPYGFFKRSAPKWYRITVKPTSVPQRLAICLDFAPTGTKGVFVHRDDSTSGHSATGLPGREARMLTSGDWMIRVELDAPKSANPLKDK